MAKLSLNEAATELNMKKARVLRWIHLLDIPFKREEKKRGRPLILTKGALKQLQSAKKRAVIKKGRKSRAVLEKEARASQHLAKAA